MAMAASFPTFQSKLLILSINTAQEVNVKIIFLPVFFAWCPNDVLSILGCWGSNWGSIRACRGEGFEGLGQSHPFLKSRHSFFLFFGEFLTLLFLSSILFSDY